MGPIGWMLVWNTTVVKAVGHWEVLMIHLIRIAPHFQFDGSRGVLWAAAGAVGRPASRTILKSPKPWPFFFNMVMYRRIAEQNRPSLEIYLGGIPLKI
jgi:hypothetical protein